MKAKITAFVCAATAACLLLPACRGAKPAAARAEGSALFSLTSEADVSSVSASASVSPNSSIKPVDGKTSFTAAATKPGGAVVKNQPSIASSQPAAAETIEDVEKNAKMMAVATDSAEEFVLPDMEPLESYAAYQDGKAEKTVTRTVMGKPVSLTYVESSRRDDGAAGFVTYRDSRGNKYGFRQSTGHLSSIEIKDANLSREFKETPSPTLANRTLDSIDPAVRKNYRYEGQTQNSWLGTYTYRFCVEVGGYQTTEAVSLTFDKNGDLTDYSRCDEGAFQGTSLERLDESIFRQRMQTALGKFYGNRLRSCNITIKFLSLSESGNLRMNYGLDMQVYSKGKTVSTGTTIVFEMSRGLIK